MLSSVRRDRRANDRDRGEGVWCVSRACTLICVLSENICIATIHKTVIEKQAIEELLRTVSRCRAAKSSLQIKGASLMGAP